MSEIASGIDYLSDKEIARANRLRNFSAKWWLRSHSLAEADKRSSESATMMQSHIQTDFVFEPPALSVPKVENFISEQEFEGLVLSCDRENKTFWARLSDCTANLSDEEAEFPMDEVSVDDWPLIVPGAIFSWNIGRERRNGQLRRVSEIRFRRRFRFSDTAAARAAQRASALASLILESNAYPTIDSP